MRIPITKPLFAWDALEDSPSLNTIRSFLDAVPDGTLLESLRQARGKGRDDYPVHVLWGTLLLAIGLRHHTMDACLEELQRNPALQLLIGIECEDAVPKPHNMSRFLTTLGEEPHLSHLRQIFDVQVQHSVKRFPTWVSTLRGTRPVYRAAWPRATNYAKPNKRKACRNRQAAAKSTRMMKARSPRWWNGSVTSCIC